MHTHITTQHIEPIRLRLFLILLLLALPVTALGRQTDERKVLILLQQLDDKDKVTSNNASEQLEQIGSAAIPHLIKALKYRDSRVRGNAARRLGYLGPGARDAVPALAEALQDRDESVIYEAADALERMELEADVAIPIFINLLKADDYLLRSRASRVLEQIGPASLPYLIDGLKSDSPKARSTVAETIGKIGPEARAAVPHLIEALKDEDWDVRMRAVDALGEIGPEAKAAIPVLINAFHDGNEGVRGGAVEALIKIGPESIPHLIEALDSESTNKFITMSALGDFGPKASSAIPKLTDLLLRDEKEWSRTEAARALGRIGPEAVPPLLVALRDANAGVRGSAARGFYAMGAKGKVAIPSLIEALRDSNIEVRRRIAGALEQMGPAAVTAVPGLMEALKDDDKDVRRAAAKALTKIGPGAKASIPDLVDALEDKDAGVRTDAVDALESVAIGEMGSDAKEKIPKLIGALQSEDEDIRRCSAGLLGKMGPEAKIAITALIGTLGDDDEGVRNRAAESLANLSFALSNAWDADSVSLLKKAHAALADSPHPKVREHAELVKQSVNYLELMWWSRVMIRVRNNSAISLLLITYLLLMLTTLGLLWLCPLWLLRINEALSNNADKLPKKIGGIDMPIRYAFVIGFFHYHPRVLDAWVNKHMAEARRTFSNKPTVEERNTYIATPVVLNKVNFPELTADALAPVFATDLSYLLICGDGGAGKTSLACLLARRALSEDGSERPSKRHLMLPVLIEQGLEFQVNNQEESLLKLIGAQLRLLIGEEDKISPELLRHLVRKRRILLIVDSLSEMEDASRSNILNGIVSLPVNACILTSRTEEQLNGLPTNTIRMLRIKGNRLATFMEAYLSHRGKRDLFDDEEFFEGCRRLSSIVGERDITALIAKYYAEQMIAAKEGSIDEDLPGNIPELMLKYINILSRVPPKDIPDIQLVHRAAEATAWECVKRSLRPAAAKRQDVLTVLGGEEKGGLLVRHLEETLKIIRSVGGAQAIRYTMDPLSEYLAGLYLVNQYGANADLWQELLNKAGEQEGAPETIKGFLIALQDCCLAKGKETGVPDFVADEITKLVGLHPEDDKEKFRIERRVRQLIPRLKLPDPEDRVEAVKALNSLNKEAKAAVPALIEALSDRDFYVRLESTYALGSIGLEAKIAAPALIRSLKDHDESVRLGAAAALMKIRPTSEAKASILGLVDALKDPYADVRRSAAFTLGNIGLDAQVAVPHLIELLKDPGDRRIAAEALSKIGPVAAPILSKIEDTEIRGAAGISLEKLEN